MSQEVEQPKPKKAYRRQGKRSGVGIINRALDIDEIANRLNTDQSPSSRSIDAQNFGDLWILRARSRHMRRKNPHMAKYVEMGLNNVVGPEGMGFQMKATNSGGGLDRATNARVEAAWARWGKLGNCTANGKMSWVDCQELAIQTLIQDGEVLIQFVFGEEAQNEFGFALHFIPVEFLDQTMTTRLPNGNRVIMGVEMDKYDRPVAYWIWPSPNESFYRQLETTERVRIPANQILHMYYIESADQSRGRPWVEPVLEEMTQLGEYNKAEVIAARMAASKAMVITKPIPDGYGGEDDDEDEEGESSPLVHDVEPGQIMELDPGYQVSSFLPEHPTTAYPEFVKGSLRTIASGLNVSHPSLGSDLEAVNYSAIRAGFLEERDNWRAIQRFFKEHFCQPIYEAWLFWALLSGALSIPQNKIERVKLPTWRPRGWAWVDPEKDVQARILSIGNRLGSRSEYVAESGRDFEEVLDELAMEEQMIKEAGLNRGGEDEKASPALQN